MPCWYFEKKEIRNSPSYRDGIDQTTENRYRREGARLILDAGTKLGLRYDTCATGVVYFHRFYMFHSFRDFHRYVMGACCLFLAGKVEETPKKCKDIIRTVQLLLTPEQFTPFGEDPREEVMTMERILLQTIKFDLQVEHPYGFLLSFAKQIKGDKEKIQKMTQMSWTFINDSLCTTLCLQWESEIIAVSLMYLASRLSKFDPSDWIGRLSGSKSKWWEDLIEGMTMDLMEDICHQVLDLYSAQQNQKAEGKPVSPPPNAPRGPRQPPQAGPRDTPPPPPRDPPPTQKRPKMESPADSVQAGNKSKKMKLDEPVRHAAPAAKSVPPPAKSASPGHKAGAISSISVQHSAPRPTPVNPYVSSSMYSSSFMSGEGQQSIQSLLGGGGTSAAAAAAPPPQSYHSYPPPGTPSQYAPSPATYTPSSYSSGYTPAQYHAPTSYASYSGSGYNQSAQPAYASSVPPSATVSTPAYNGPPPTAYAAPPPNIPPPPVSAYSAPYAPAMAQPSPSGHPPHFPPPGYGAPPPQSGYCGPIPMMSHRPQGTRPIQRNLTPVRQVNERGGMR